MRVTENVRSATRTIFRVIAVGTAATAVLVGLIFLCVYYGMRGLVKQNFAHQAQLLYQVDHRILGREARTFASDQRKRFEMPRSVWLGEPDVPPSLAILKPGSITITDDLIRLEFGGALLHYGLVVYNEGLEGPGTKKLDEGVWFYSENGRYPGRNDEVERGPPEQ